MIRRIRHKGLDRFYRDSDIRGLDAKHVSRLRLQLGALDRATVPDGMNLPGWRLHLLKGERKGQWAVSVSANWRLVFEFEDGHATNIDLVDYH
jgi:proteic killer suppression protein